MLVLQRAGSEGWLEDSARRGGFLLGACVFRGVLIFWWGRGFCDGASGGMAAFVFVRWGWRFSSGGGCGKLAGFFDCGWRVGVCEIRADSLDVAVSRRRLAYVFTGGLMAVNVALACFLLVRRAKGVGYSIVGENDGNCMCWGVSFCLGACDTAGDKDAVYCV